MRTTLAALVLMAASLPLFAQAPAPAAAPPGEAAPAASPDTAAPDAEALHDELRAMRTAVETAINKRDIEGLLEHVTPDVVFTAMTGEVGRGKAGVREYFDRMLQGDEPVFKSVTMNFEPSALSILHGGDTAISFGTNHGRYEFSNGKVMEVDAQWTTTLVRQDGAWKIAAVQMGADLFDNPVLGEQRRLLLLAAGGAALVAAVLGFWFGRRRRAAA